MEEASSRKKSPPQWWLKVIKDLEKAALAAKKSYYQPRVVIGNIEEEDGNITGYLIRLENGDVGYYAAKDIPKDLPTGVRLTGKIPKPDSIKEEPKIESFTFEVIRENIKLLPRIWLNRTLKKILGGQPITMKDDLRAFPEWISISFDKKTDKDLIDILYRVTQYEGLKGLSRFNDLSNY
jgi:hypothetical protein